jgi:aromatic ring-opening dioxygenase LigB subunit
MGGRSTPQVRAVAVSPARDRPVEEHVRAGQALARAAAASPKRIALIASADHGHAHDPDGPYGFDPAAATYDETIVRLVQEDRLSGLLELEPALVDAAKADSWWQLAMLHGALGDDWRGDFLSYEASTYFGMLCAAYVPN